MAQQGSDAGEGLVVGGDLGGTSTRIVVADLAGQVVARGEGPGGNPVAHPETAARVFARVLVDALAGVDPGSVRAGVIGMAGSGAVRDPRLRAAYEASWQEAGLPGAPVVCTDLEVAFAAGTRAGAGSVLIAGTGAVAGRIRDHRLVANAGGHGWLLGDEGSGFWVGREAARATLRVLEGGRGGGVLTGAVLRELGVAASTRDARAAVISAVHASPPVALSALSPLVSDAHLAGDAAATAILDAAVGHLLRTWERLDVAPGEPVVLAGSLTDPAGYPGTRLRDGLADRAVTPLQAAEPVAGAVWLALRGLERN